MGFCGTKASGKEAWVEVASHAEESAMGAFMSSQSFDQ
jgi:hypothetical protein